MEYILVKTRILKPPKDDLYKVLDESLNGIKEDDVVLITSKVLSIHQGRCLLAEDVKNKRALIEKESDYVITLPENETASIIGVKYHTILYAGGIDESNGNGHYILMPEKPFDSAQDIWEFLKDRNEINNLGIIITDSYAKPMRTGATGTAIAWWGFHPVENHQGKSDLFNRTIRHSTTNIVDSIASGASVVCGETNECTPIIIARNIPNLEYTKIDTRHELFKAQKDDMYYPLLKPFFKK